MPLSLRPRIKPDPERVVKTLGRPGPTCDTQRSAQSKVGRVGNTSQQSSSDRARSRECDAGVDVSRLGEREVGALEAQAACAEGGSRRGALKRAMRVRKEARGEEKEEERRWERRDRERSRRAWEEGSVSVEGRRNEQEHASPAPMTWCNSRVGSMDQVPA